MYELHIFSTAYMLGQTCSVSSTVFMVCPDKKGKKRSFARKHLRYAIFSFMRSVTTTKKSRSWNLPWLERLFTCLINSQTMTSVLYVSAPLQVWVRTLWKIGLVDGNVYIVGCFFFFYSAPVTFIDNDVSHVTFTDVDSSLGR